MRMLIAFAAVLVAATPVIAEPMTTTPPGRIFHYLRTNIDGTEPEHIRVFLRDATHLEVYKMVEKCTNAALVTAELDLERGYAPHLVGGRLKPNAEHSEFAFLNFNAATNTIKMEIKLPDQTIAEEKKATAPFHIYDFDLASLTVFGPTLTKSRKPIAFDFLLLWPDGKPGDQLRALGRAELVFKAEEARNSRAALRYEAAGPGFAGKGGPIWFDKADGHIIDVEWGIPNHSEYRDFKLKLLDIDNGGSAAWKRVLTAQFEGCK